MGKVIKKQIPEAEKKVLFQVIIDRDGIVSRREAKLIDTNFLSDFLKYMKTVNSFKCRKPNVVIYNLFKDFGQMFVVNYKNIDDVMLCPSIVRFCKISNHISGSDWAESIVSSMSSSTSERLVYLKWVDLAANAILSDLDVNKLLPICSAYGIIASQYKEIHPVGNKQKLKSFKSYMRELAKKLNEDIDPSTYDKIQTKLMIAITLVYDSCHNFVDGADMDVIKELLEDIIYANARGSCRLAPVPPKYYNPFTFEEYYRMVLTYNLVPDYNLMGDYLDLCDEDTRKQRMFELVTHNGNNIMFADPTTGEVSNCLKYLVYDNERAITGYLEFRRAYPYWCDDSTTNKFLKYGDIGSIFSDDILAMFSSPEKIRIIARRKDAKQQYISLFKEPNGMIYLSSAIQYLTPFEMIDLMRAYVEYIDTIENYGGGVSMDIYMAGLIKNRVDINTMIKSCPKMLRYIEASIADFPTEYDFMDEWLNVAMNTPITNLADGTLFQRIMRLDKYIPFNYHHHAFSVESFGIEEVIDDATELRKLVEAHPGYYFDIMDEDVRKLMMEYLAEKLS